MSAKKIKKIDTVAITMIILAGAVMLYLWSLNPEFRTLFVGEPYVDANQFIPGANFRQFGFVKLRFTADYAVGPAQYHPFYYTHNPPLSEIINGLYQKLGLLCVERQRLVCIVWSLLGFFFFYAMIRLLVGSKVALWSLIIALTNPYVLYWGDNLFFSHQWMFIFLSLYFFLLFIHRRSPLYCAIAWFAFFCAAFSNYELIPLMIFFALGLKIFHLERVYLRDLLVFLSAPLVAFCLRNLLIIWAIGYKVWFYDLLEILLHRTLGIRTPIIEMYKNVPIILWVPEPKIPSKYLWLLYARLENLYGYGWSLFLILLVFPFIRSRLLPVKNVTRLFHLILLFFVTGTIWYILFPQQTSEHFHSHTMQLFLPFTCLIWSVVLIGLWKNIRYMPMKITTFAIILFAITAARVINFIPPRPFPGIEALKKYEKKVFCTNAIPTLVEYYTKTPAAFCGYGEQFNDLRNGRYYFFLRTDLIPPPYPEFFFSVYGSYDKELAYYFPLVERGKEYAIYRLEPK